MPSYQSREMSTDGSSYILNSNWNCLILKDYYDSTLSPSQKKPINCFPVIFFTKHLKLFRQSFINCRYHANSIISYRAKMRKMSYIPVEWDNHERHMFGLSAFWLTDTWSWLKCNTSSVIICITSQYIDKLLEKVHHTCSL